MQYIDLVRTLFKKVVVIESRLHFWNITQDHQVFIEEGLTEIVINICPTFFILEKTERISIAG